MMMFDFECTKCAKVFEDLVPSSTTNVPCVDCKGKALRLIAAPRIDWKHMGTDPSFPSAYKKWGDEQTKHHKHDKGQRYGGKAHNLSMY